jgi:hypothetical protein
MINPSLQDQLKELKGAGVLKVKHPVGYKKWKAKFDYWFSITKDVQQAFNIMYGPGGGVNHYRGGLLCNSGVKIPVPQPHKKKAKKPKEKRNG